MSELQQTLSGLMTGLLLILFIGICIWSWSGKRKESFKQMANLPLEHDETPIRHAHICAQMKADKEKCEASL
jgi:cytochrome c oxidase cbb3-type subunit 4